MKRSTVLWIAAGVLLMLSAVCYFTADQAFLARLEAKPYTGHFDPWINGIRQLGKAGVPLWLLALWVVVTNRPKAAAAGVIALLLVLAAVAPVKAVFGRLRPEKAIMARTLGEDDPQVRAGSPSFPSGDTATVFALAGVIALSARVSWAAIAFALAAIVGFLRVLTLDHYLSDVFAGAALGIAASICAKTLVRRKILFDPVRLCERFWRIVLGLYAGIYLVVFGLVKQSDPLAFFMVRYWFVVILFYVMAYFVYRVPAEEEPSERGY